MGLKYVLIFCVLFRFKVFGYYVDPEEKIVMMTIKKCAESPSRLSCFADKAANLLERSMNMDFYLFDGIKLQRNSEPYDNSSTPRSLSPFTRFTTALYNFLDTHTVFLDLTSDEGRSKRDDDEESEKQGGGGGLSLLSGFGLGGGGGKGGSKGSKGMKCVKYAFMVLLGIFGLTGPIFMKTLAVIAAKALIASKAALIIVGSVALKKIFQKESEKSTLKVHTIHDEEDEHDRIYQNQIPYNYYGDYYTKPA